MDNNLILNRLFTQKFFKELINYHNYDAFINVVDKYCDLNNNKTNLDVLIELYNKLRNEYRNEYFYKNTILNKLLLGVHSINTTTALSEIPISSSKADFVLINGKSVVYEIKTQLDTLERLEKQVNDYYKAFDHVCVITCENYCDEVLEMFNNTKVGVYVLSSKERIKKIKIPEKYDNNLNCNVMFKVLNKREYENILMHYYNRLPETSQVKYYTECKKMFCDIPNELRYELYLKELKERNSVNNKIYFNETPYELKSVIYFSQYRDADYKVLYKFLQKEIGGLN